jgi:hypothetical protein
MTQAYNLSQFANFLNSSGQVSASGIQSGVVVPSGTVSLFYQASAPTGWSQITSLNDYDLRLVSGVGGTTGGTTAYSTVFTNQTPSITGGTLSATIGATTLSTAQMPSHAHSPGSGEAFVNREGYYTGSNVGTENPFAYSYSGTTASEGGDGSHTHSFSGSVSAITSSAITLNVRYANIIICSKN